jgi:NAD(P)-dependent dehydrogenase (short-subunit alcohol dehydrogenase family)
MARLAGKIAVITGAASGIGRAGALRFAREGATVAVVDVDRTGAEETVALVEAGAGTACAFACDVAVEEQVTATYRAVEAAFGGLDVLYSNAGIPMTVPLERLTVEQWDRVMEVNARGTFLMAKHAAPLLERRGGAIVTTGSTVGLVPTTNRASYVASKGAIIMLTKALALELGPRGIRVNCVCPGPIDTPAMRTFLTSQFGAERPIEEHLATYGTLMPLRRIGTGDDVAAAAAFLASDDASWITGAILPVDGGKTISAPELFGAEMAQR